MDLHETGLVAELESKLTKYATANKTKSDYYDGSAKPTEVGIAVPPQMRGQAPHVGWAGTVVDAVEERIQFLGWFDPEGNLGLDEIYFANFLDVESGLAHLDALMFGTGFVGVSGIEDGGSPLVTVEPATNTTGIWDFKTRRLSSAFQIAPESQSQGRTATLFLPNENVLLEGVPGDWKESGREKHNYGRVPVVMLPNRTSASMRLGRSEISKPVRDIVDEAARVLLAMAVNREFFSAPQRLVLGVAPGDIDGWMALISGIWTIEPDEDGKLPTVTSFDQVKPGPHIEQLKALAAQMAAVAGIPENYLGVAATANPASADAIRAAEVRLIKKAERRCQMFGMAWLEVARLALIARDGTVPEAFGKVSCRWGDPATPTSAAKADEASKLVGAGIIPPHSSVTYDRVGLSPAEQSQVEADWSREPSVTNVLADVASRQASGDSLKDSFDAIGVAVRAGVDPDEAADRVGMPGLKFTGAVPVSLRLPEADAVRLEKA